MITSLNPERLTLLREVLSVNLQEPYCEPVVEEWYGWRPLTWDSRPILDRAPVGKNVWIAAGHNMLGLSMARPRVSYFAEMLTGREPHINPRPYRLIAFRSGSFVAKFRARFALCQRIPEETSCC